MKFAFGKQSNQKKNRRGERKLRSLRRMRFFEKLEDRQLLSASPVAPMASLAVVQQLPGIPLMSFVQNFNGDAAYEQRIDFGMPNDPGLRPGSKVMPIVGDWNGSGYDWPGVVIPHHNGGLQFKLDNDGEPLEEYRFFFGFWDDQFAVGDLNGDGYDDIVVVRPGADDRVSGKKFLDWRVTYGPFPTLGSPETDTFLPIHDTFSYGLEGDQIVLGDWNGDGKADLGVISKDPVFSQGAWRYQWWLPMPGGIRMIPFGEPGGRPIVGNWDGIGGDNIGVVWDRPGAALALWQLDTNWDSRPNIDFEYGFAGDPSLIGRWKDITAPTATLGAVSPAQFGATEVLVQVQYRDNAAINASSIDSSDLRITGPTGAVLPVQVHSQATSADGTLTTATYRVLAPGGTWDPADNGQYTVNVQSNQVHDTTGNPVAGGKIGEFTVDLTVPMPTVDLISPVIPEVGSKPMTVQVRYTSVAGIDVSSIDSRDISVVGPTGNSLSVTFQAIDKNWNGSPRIATYHVAAPGGTWGAEDNGVYTINVQPNEVKDIYGGYLVAGHLGQFTVSLVPPSPAPSATVRPGSVTTPGLTQHWVEVTFTGYPALECSTVSQDDIYVIRTSNGQEIRPSNYVRQGVCLAPSTAREVTASYAIQGPGGTWDSLDNGWYDVYVRAGEVRDTSGRAVPAGKIGSFEANIAPPNVDITPPVGALVVIPAPKAGQTHVDVRVRYTDNVAVDVGSFAPSNIRVTRDNGQVLTVTSVTSDQPTNGTPRIATYRVQAPGGTWDAADNGRYAILLVAGSVRDTSNNGVAATSLDEFQVGLPVPPPSTGMISGTVFHDANRNMRRDAGEPGFGNRLVYLDTNGNGRLDAGEPNTRTNAAGWYGFYNLPAGTYQVRQQLAPGWQQTVPGCGGSSYGGAEPVKLTTTASMEPAYSSDSLFSAIDLPDLTPEMQQSLDLINWNRFRTDSRFANVDGREFSAVVLDTGIDLDHRFFGPDANRNGIADRIVFQYDFADKDADASDRNGHGTHVTSILGSQDSQYPGLAPGVNLIHLKVFKDSGDGKFSYVEDALQWVEQNVERFNIASVNLSLGDAGNHDRAVLREELGLDDELAALAAKDVIVVAAAGNRYSTFGSQAGVAYPAADPSTIGVGAVWDANVGRVDWRNGAIDYSTGPDRVVSFSQRHGSLSEVFAPGAWITAAHLNNSAKGDGGTSMAAPHVAGAAVLAQQLAVEHLGRRLTLDEFRELAIVTGVTIHDGDDENTNVLPSGLSFPRLDVMAMAEGILAMTGCAHTVVLSGGDSKTADFGSTQLVSSNSTSAREGSASTSAPWIGSQTLQPIVEAARARWQQAGIADLDAALLNTVQFQTTDLPGSLLTQTLGTTVTLDGNAADHGWFIDPTPMSDEEFQRLGGEMIATPGGQVGNRYDLLSVVMREMGRFIESQTQVDLGEEAIGVGVRTVPTAVAPLLSRADSTPIVVNEGERAAIRLRLSAPASQNVSVDYATVSMTADENDFTSTSGTLVIPAGAMEGTIHVQTKTDLILEGDETFAVRLTNPNHVILGEEEIDVTIRNVVAGRLAVSGPDQNVRGTAYPLTLGATGATANHAGFQWVVDWGDGTAKQVFYNAATRLNTFLAGKSEYTIQVELKGPDGTRLDQATKTVRMVSAVPQAVRLNQPYVQTFSGALPQGQAGFEYFTTGDGRNHVVNGTLRQEDSVRNRTPSQVEATLHLDLAGQQNVFLSVDFRHYNKKVERLPAQFTGHAKGDGIAISADGQRWYAIPNLKLTGAGTVRIKLDDVIRQNGLQFTSDFQIRFQHHGTQPVKRDGIDWDNIRVEVVPLPTAQKVTPAQPYVQNFTAGLPQGAAGFEYYTTGEGRNRVLDGRWVQDDPVRNQIPSLNEGILHLDVAGQSDVWLTVDYNHFNRKVDRLPTRFTGHANGDGIAISDDGWNWHTIASSNLLRSGTLRLDLDQLVQQFGLDRSKLQVKFQQYGTQPARKDGIEWDNLRVESFSRDLAFQQWGEGESAEFDAALDVERSVAGTRSLWRQAVDQLFHSAAAAGRN